MFMEWTETGKFHIENNKSNEDAIVTLKNGKNVAVALCDGVSTCQNSEAGAKVACASLCDFFGRKGCKLAFYDSRTIAKKTVSHILYDLKKYSEKTGNTMESLSSTAASVVYDYELSKVICINIGDALIGGIGKDGYETIISPQKHSRGCYTTTTKGVERVADIVVLDAGKFDSIFICSDGMWKGFYQDRYISGDIDECLRTKDYKRMISIVQMGESYDDRSIVVMDLEDIKEAQPA